MAVKEKEKGQSLEKPDQAWGWRDAVTGLRPCGWTCGECWEEADAEETKQIRMMRRSRGRGETEQKGGQAHIEPEQRGEEEEERGAIPCCCWGIAPRLPAPEQRMGSSDRRRSWRILTAVYSRRQRSREERELSLSSVDCGGALTPPSLTCAWKPCISRDRFLCEPVFPFPLSRLRALLPTAIHGV